MAPETSTMKASDLLGFLAQALDFHVTTGTAPSLQDLRELARMLEALAEQSRTTEAHINLIDARIALLRLRVEMHPLNDTIIEPGSNVVPLAAFRRPSGDKS